MFVKETAYPSVSFSLLGRHLDHGIVGLNFFKSSIRPYTVAFCFASRNTGYILLFFHFNPRDF